MAETLVKVEMSLLTLLNSHFYSGNKLYLWLVIQIIPKQNREGSVVCHLSYHVESFISPIVRSEEIDINNGNL